MSFQSNRFYFKIAEKSDSSELMEIIEANEFKGNISLLYTRRQDAYSSFMMEGEKVLITALKDKLCNKLVGFGACAINKLYINEEIKKCGYLFGLRGRDEYRRKFPVLNKGYDYLFNELKEDDIYLYFTTILEGNLDVIKLLEKKRSFMPVYDYVGNYDVFCFKTGYKFKSSDSYIFRKAEAYDMKN